MFLLLRGFLVRAAPNYRTAGPAGMFEALHSPWALFGAAAIGLYVGAEVSIGSIMINFLNHSSVLGLPFEDAGAYLANFYWGGALCGRVVGTALLTKVRAALLLGGCGIVNAMLCFTVLTTHGSAAGYAALAIGFFNSIMFPTIFTITLERSGVSQSSTSGLLCLAIFGGALLPIAVGVIADNFGLGASFAVPLAAYAFIAFFAVAARNRSQGRERAHLAGYPMITALLAAAAVAAAEPPRSILFVGNSFTFGADSDAMTYRKNSVTDLNGEGMGGVPALFKRFADEAGLRYNVSLETAAGQTLAWHLANKGALIDRSWDAVVLQQYSTLNPDKPGDVSGHDSRGPGALARFFVNAIRESTSASLRPGPGPISLIRPAIIGQANPSNAWLWICGRLTTRYVRPFLRSVASSRSGRHSIVRLLRRSRTQTPMTGSRPAKSICGRAIITMRQTRAIISRR